PHQRCEDRLATTNRSPPEIRVPPGLTTSARIANRPVSVLTGRRLIEFPLRFLCAFPPRRQQHPHTERNEAGATERFGRLRARPGELSRAHLRDALHARRCARGGSRSRIGRHRDAMILIPTTGLP